jgi:hypothetical protein
LLAVLLIFALTVVGFYAYQNAAMEFYYSWPYATMGAEALASCDLESAPIEDGSFHTELTSEDVCVEDYRVLVEYEGIMKETVLHGVSVPAPEKINETIFNSRALGDVPANLDGVWIDEKLARELGVRVSNEVRLIQRSGKVELSAKVTAIVPTYAPTQGVVTASAFVAAMAPYSFSVYKTDGAAISNFEEKAESAGITVSMQTREDACQSAKLMAQKFLPFARNDTLQIAAVFLSAGVFFVFFSMVIRRQKKRFFQPLISMGLRLRGIISVVTMELSIAAVPISALAGFAAVVGLKLSYGFPISFMLFLSTTALLLGGVLIGGLCVLLALWVNLRHRLMR